MMKFIYETNVPGLIPLSEIQLRVARWKKAGITHVFQNAYDGRGATWNSTYMVIDSRVNPANAKIESDYIREQGLSLIAVFDIHHAVTGPAIRNEFLLTPTVYDLWNTNFVKWRADTLKEYLSLVDCEGIAFDFIRTGLLKHTNPDITTEPDIVVSNALGALKSEVYPYPVYSVSPLNIANKRQEGVQIAQWMEQGLIDYACLFHYGADWPSLDGYDRAKILTLSSSFAQSPLASLSSVAVSKNLRKNMKLNQGLKGVGLFTANMFTDSQAIALSTIRE